MFRMSSDGGTTFEEKKNLSNTTRAESVDVELAVDGNNIVITWWERNQTSDEPVARISTDGGQIFGERIMLSANDTSDTVNTTNNTTR